MNTAHVVRKWQPLLAELDTVAAVYTAHVMEAEATYLRKLSEEDRTKAQGPALKYIFPLLRRAIARITVLDNLALRDDVPAFTKLVSDAIEEAADLIFDAELTRPHAPQASDSIRDLLDKNALRAIAERAAAAYLAVDA